MGKFFSKSFKTAIWATAVVLVWAVAVFAQTTVNMNWNSSTNQWTLSNASAGGITVSSLIQGPASNLKVGDITQTYVEASQTGWSSQGVFWTYVYNPTFLASPQFISGSYATPAATVSPYGSEMRITLQWTLNQYQLGDEYVKLTWQDGTACDVYNWGDTPAGSGSYFGVAGAGKYGTLGEAAEVLVTYIVMSTPCGAAAPQRVFSSPAHTTGTFWGPSNQTFLPGHVYVLNSQGKVVYETTFAYWNEHVKDIAKQEHMNF